ncbi:MAG: ROK family protein [Fidelibacterota bacterium]|nr:MAG: ROK family protein [Candidatus Neomarinimicrobiota bacterium]
MAVIGVDLGGTKAAAAVMDKEGQILHRETGLLEHRQGSEVGRLIIDQVEKLLTAVEAEQANIEAVGVSVPGIYYAQTGHVWAPNIPGWEEYPLQTELEDFLKPQGIQAAIDSDRACYILGETWLGSAKGCKDAIFLAVGTGIGAGIMVDGNILRGYQDIAGAIGWLALERPFEQEYVGCGCFEYHASGEGIAKVARSLMDSPAYASSNLRSLRPEELTAQHVFEAYKADDPLAVHVLDECVELWGMAAANLVSLFNPEKIIFGGGVFGPAIQFLDRIVEEAHRWAQPISIQQVTIEASTLGGDAGLLGAGSLALRYIRNK